MTPQSGPRDLESVLASRFTLTPRGMAATLLDKPDEAKFVAKRAFRVGHRVTVTPTVFGRHVVECSCGDLPERVHPSSRAGNLAGLTHAIEVLS